MNNTINIFGKTITADSYEELYRKLVKVLAIHEPRVTSRGDVTGEQECARVIDQMEADLKELGIKFTVTYQNGMDSYAWF